MLLVMLVYEGQEIADQWYSEVERYNFNKHAGPNTGILSTQPFLIISLSICSIMSVHLAALLSVINFA